MLGGKKEFIIVHERNPACAPSIGVETVLEDRPLLRDTRPFVQCDLAARHKRPDDRFVLIAGIVVVKIEMLESNRQVKANPFVQIRGRVLEDETGGQIMHGGSFKQSVDGRASRTRISNSFSTHRSLLFHLPGIISSSNSLLEHWPAQWRDGW